MKRDLFHLYTRLLHLPGSDDGESSMEIIRVPGDPLTGDIRSRLIPPAKQVFPLDALCTFGACPCMAYKSFSV
ncbi:hypothetical protein FA95DRAFT_1612117 [Auriscalpium vulgare]|uniref:Uncharacterized protein n=1 Tax=Auriscalpium vulgare TaxID=40419 RepID=A0ACB8R8B1_9AGAM|nr:hypothetical protein FA95DRAFT_1612117 [Auriscalpium vulgare]